MPTKIPPNIILHNSKEVIFYISKDKKESINITLWIHELNLPKYKGMIIHSKCIFNRLQFEASSQKN